MGVLAAILDDGVYEGFFPIPQIMERWSVSQKGSVLGGQKGTPFPSHGTVCAAIIEKLCPGSQFISLQVLDQEGQGSVAQLEAALHWCLERKVRLIHMSLGTANYHDFPKIQRAVRALTDQGTLIVAAYNNYNVPSWPAHLPRVFGVRQDLTGELPAAGIGFDMKNGLLLENSLVARYDALLCGEYGVELPTKGANSTAAPVVSAKIACYLLGNEELSFKEIMVLLTKDGVLVHSAKFCDYTQWQEREVTVPIISADREDIGWLSEKLTQDGYCHEILAEDGGNGWIPLSLYGSRITPGLLWVLERIYKPDIFLVQNMDDANFWADAQIAGVGPLEWRVQEYTKSFLDRPSLYAELLRYFNVNKGG